MTALIVDGGSPAVVRAVCRATEEREKTGAFPVTTIANSSAADAPALLVVRRASAGAPDIGPQHQPDAAAGLALCSSRLIDEEGLREVRASVALARGEEDCDEKSNRQASDDIPSFDQEVIDEPRALVSGLTRCLVVAAFWISHTCSVYTTKALLSRPGRTTRSIVVVTWCQCATSCLLVLALGSLGEHRSPFLAEMAKALPTNALLGGWNSKSFLGGGAGAVGLASVLFSLAVFSDNACLGVVNASFFQVARALTLPFVTILGYVSSRSLPPRDLLLPCVLCIVGFFLGVHSQTPEAFWDGTSMGIIASVLTAAYTRLLARAEPREAWRVTYVTNRNASVLLVPAAVYTGMGDPAYLSGHESFLLKDGDTMLLAVMASILPALAGVATMWQAQAGLGAMALAASFVGRAAFSHLLAYYVFGNSPVAVGEVGCGLVLTGLALYASARGGAAVAQAGNVAVPGAARYHFVPSSSPSPQFTASTANYDPRGICGLSTLKRRISDLDQASGGEVCVDNRTLSSTHPRRTLTSSESSGRGIPPGVDGRWPGGRSGEGMRQDAGIGGKGNRAVDDKAVDSRTPWRRSSPVRTSGHAGRHRSPEAGRDSDGDGEEGVSGTPSVVRGMSIDVEMSLRIDDSRDAPHLFDPHGERPESPSSPRSSADSEARLLSSPCEESTSQRQIRDDAYRAGVLTAIDDMWRLARGEDANNDRQPVTGLV